MNVSEEVKPVKVGIENHYLIQNFISILSLATLASGASVASGEAISCFEEEIASSGSTPPRNDSQRLFIKLHMLRRRVFELS